MGHDLRTTIIVVAHNEESRIEGRIENLLGLEYPVALRDIIIASDGSTDRTVELARRYEPQVSVVGFPRRRGKAAVLNDLIPTATGDIVVLADARQVFDSQALRALDRNFADPEIGGVSGELILRGDETATSMGHGVSQYWRYEKFIRRAESQIDSTVGATGAIYAIRRQLYEPVPSDTILDDVLIPLRITAKGYRVAFEPAARAYDSVPASAADEFRRKVRTIAGNFQIFARETWLFDPRRNRLWVQAVSHKLLRLLSPALIALLAVSNAALASAGTSYQIMLLGQCAFYAAAIAGTVQAGCRTVVAVPYAFCVLNWATIVAFQRFISGRQAVTWERS
jgi:cellulose synthase/poly-beta-1,6-N-acetylglucosamine synthase-like glycosyltransferase